MLQQQKALWISQTWESSCKTVWQSKALTYIRRGVSALPVNLQRCLTLKEQIARELSSQNIYWCYKLMLLQLLYLLQVYSVQQIKIEQHYELCSDNNQLLFCLVSLLNNNMTNAFEIICYFCPILSLKHCRTKKTFLTFLWLKDVSQKHHTERNLRD